MTRSQQWQEDHHLWLQIKWNWFPLSRDSSEWWSIMCKQLANSLPASQGYVRKELGWGKPRMKKDISTTDLNYLSPSQKAWLRSHLWISHVACWIGHCWQKKNKSVLFLPPRFHSKDTTHMIWKKCIYMCPSLPCCFWSPDFTRARAIPWADPSTAISSMEKVTWRVYSKFEYESKCEVAKLKSCLPGVFVTW